MGQTALHIACAVSSENVVEGLLNAGAEVHCRSSRPSMPITVTNNDAALENMLDDFRYSPTDDGGHDEDGVFGVTGTPLHYAVEYGRVTSAKALFRKDPRVVNIPDDLGQTTLHRLAKRHYYEGPEKELVELLIEAGIDINARDKEGMSAIHYAAETRLCDDLDESNIDSERMESDSLQWNLLRTLLSKGIPIDVLTEATVDHPGRATPLQFSCKAGHENAVRYLLNRGADPDHVDNNGRTALHWACATVPHVMFGH
jgi:ankyrin repeat protein